MAKTDPLAMPAKSSAKAMAVKLPLWLRTLLIGLVQKYGPEVLKAIIDWLAAEESAKKGK